MTDPHELNPRLTCPRWLRLLPLVGALSMPLAAQAHEADWLHFPMYERDTAHAVHLKALRLRPDGLLASASRYPRHGAAGWTAEQDAAGWYAYDERLIDCQTGYSLVTRRALLDQDGGEVASRTPDAEETLWQLARALEEPAEGPSGEILLACAAAADTDFLRQREQSRQQPVPLLSDVPLVARYLDDSRRFLGLRKLPGQADWQRLRGQPGRPASALFHSLRKDWLAKRALLDPGWRLAGKPSEAQQQELMARLKSSGGSALIDLASLRDLQWLGGGLVAIETVGQRWSAWQKPPATARKATQVASRDLLDCYSGLQLSTERLWQDDKGRLVWRETLRVQDVQDQMGHWLARLSNEEALPLFDRRNGLCQALRPPAQELELTAEQLAALPSPETRLLHLRAAKQDPVSEGFLR